MKKIIETTTPIQRQLLEQNENFNAEIDARLCELEDVVWRVANVVNTSQEQTEIMKDWLRNSMNKQDAMFEKRMIIMNSSLSALEEQASSMSDCVEQFNKQDRLLNELRKEFKPQIELLSSLKTLLGSLQTSLKR